MTNLEKYILQADVITNLGRQLGGDFKSVEGKLDKQYQELTMELLEAMHKGLINNPSYDNKMMLETYKRTIEKTL